MRKSRLSKNTEKKQVQTIILSLIGIIIVLFLLFKYGISFLVNISLFFSASKTQQTTSNSNQINFVAPPILNPVPSATNSANIVISGTSLQNMTIDLFNNNKKIDEMQSAANGKFAFEEILKNGDNQIEAQTTSNDKKSDFSNVLEILYKNSPPTLNLVSPSDGQQFKKDQNTALVSGTTDPGVSVTVNGFWAVVDDNNNFTYTLPLQNGDNQIKVVATDQAGNKIEKDLKVNYSQ